MRLIKKYPNRRLYDTEYGAYITLNDVKKLVLDSEQFMIIDLKKGKDVTRNVLLQVLIEEENTNKPVFSVEFLLFMIRCYGHPMQSLFYSHLEKNMNDFLSSGASSKDVSSNEERCTNGSGGCAGNFPSIMGEFPNFWSLPFFQDMVKTYMNNTNVMFDQMKDHIDRMCYASSVTADDKNS
ncbi:MULTISPECIES: polyhydroxyalkanoate synthesis repressor PhaR [Candidatus Ichthyocystis]|uniref:polyhydroxyalkanoate synthesis repressor PhaR n=1 Tax=Candidatus Ichthyocystis TaxID=2929841 RepID=UPI000AA4E010|nr:MULTISPECIES: polyhydroxyalkanoate synthesis repressor PhaR [Ichthyocystis]